MLFCHVLVFFFAYRLNPIGEKKKTIHRFFQVTRVVLLWVNNHFNDFEGDPAMTRFLEEFEKNLENTVGAKKSDCHTF